MKTKILDIMTAPDYEGMTEKELLEAAGISSKQAGEFLSELDLMEMDGEVYQTKKKKYILPETVGLLPARISRSKRNFGFAIPLREEGEGDIFISRNDLGGAMNGDTVLVSVTADQPREGGAGSREGRVVRILQSRSSASWAHFFR